MTYKNIRHIYEVYHNDTKLVRLYSKTDVIDYIKRSPLVTRVMKYQAHGNWSNVTEKYIKEEE